MLWRRARSKFRVELLKRLEEKPDASCAVVLVLLAVRIGAAVDSVNVCIKFRRLLSVLAGHAVNCWGELRAVTFYESVRLSSDVT